VREPRVRQGQGPDEKSQVKDLSGKRSLAARLGEIEGGGSKSPQRLGGGLGMPSLTISTIKAEDAIEQEKI
jgi:hypothetical protein